MSESTDANAKGLMWSALAIFGGIILVGIAVSSLISAVAHPRNHPDPTRFPSPRLQTDPENELRAYREEQRMVLQSYGCGDVQCSIVRVPIERAMEALSGGK